MTNTSLATVSSNPVEINKLFGFDSGKPKPIIPALKINGADEDEGSGCPKGTFVFDSGDKLLYSDSVTIRAYYKGLQYRIWDGKDKTKNDMSIIANSFRAEFRSTSGRIACGKLPKKQYIELGDAVTTQQKELQDTVKCKLIVFGLVSGKFTDIDTRQEVDLKDELFMWVTSQSSFMIMDGAITGIERERRPVPCTPIKLKLKKEKSGSVTYFIPVPEVTNDTVALDVPVDSDRMDKIAKFVSDTNKFVDDKYNEALKGKNLDKEFSTLGEILDNDPLAL